MLVSLCIVHIHGYAHKVCHIERCRDGIVCDGSVWYKGCHGANVVKAKWCQIQHAACIITLIHHCSRHWWVGWLPSTFTTYQVSCCQEEKERFYLEWTAPFCYKMISSHFKNFSVVTVHVYISNWVSAVNDSPRWFPLRELKPQIQKRGFWRMIGGPILNLLLLMRPWEWNASACLAIILRQHVE